MPPYVVVRNKNGTFHVSGFLGDLWSILENSLNFTSKYIDEDYNDGRQQLINRTRDVLLRPIVVTTDDVDVFDHTMPVASTWYGLFIKHTGDRHTSESYIRNFTVDLWIGLGAICLLFILMLYTTLHITDNLYKEKKFKIKPIQGDLRPNAKLTCCILHTLAVICGQGCLMESNLISIRLIMFSSLSFGLVLCNSYSALLYSQLAVTQIHLPFYTLDEIPEKGKSYSLCVRDESYAFLHFKVTDYSKELEDKWEGIVNKEPCVRGIQPPSVMCEERVVLLETSAVMFTSLANNFECNMMRLRGQYSKIAFAMLIKEKFSDEGRREINNQIVKLRETGLLPYLYTKWLEITIKPHLDDNVNLYVKFEHVAGVLMIYGIILVFCLLLFTAELSISRCRKQQRFIH